MSGSDKSLWDRYAKTQDPTELIEYYTPYANKISRTYYNKMKHYMSLEEIQSSALVGLWKAILKYEPERGVMFKTFASQKISGNIIDDVRDEDSASRSLRDRMKDIEKATKNLSYELNREPTNQELADHLDVDVDKITEYKRREVEHKKVSIPQTTDQDDENSYTFVDNIAVYDEEKINIKELVSTAISILSKRERLLFGLLYFENLTLDQCTPILKLTHPMVCQMNFRIADKMEAHYVRALKRT